MMIESIFKSFDVSNATENLSCPLFWNEVSKRAADFYSRRVNQFQCESYLGSSTADILTTRAICIHILHMNYNRNNVPRC